MISVAILVFPGTLCDRDIALALEQISGVKVISIWHTQEVNLFTFDAIILPGGFSYGDALRAGAIASHSPLLDQVRDYASQQRGLLLGICNGFQILTELGLLPGTLHLNRTPRFLCQPQPLHLLHHQTPFTRCFEANAIVNFPIAHKQGNYMIDAAGHQALLQNNQILFRYAGHNPNGSCDAIAGVMSQDQRILGLMPHPERNVLPAFGDGSGRLLFQSMVDFLNL